MTLTEILILTILIITISFSLNIAFTRNELAAKIFTTLTAVSVAVRFFGSDNIELVSVYAFFVLIVVYLLFLLFNPKKGKKMKFLSVLIMVPMALNISQQLAMIPNYEFLQWMLLTTPVVYLIALYKHLLWKPEMAMFSLIVVCSLFMLIEAFFSFNAC